MNKFAPPAPKDCMMISLRDVTVTSTLGHTVFIPAKTPTRVPGPLVDKASEQGCVAADEAEYTAQVAKKTALAEEQEQFRRRLVAAVNELVVENDLKNFTPSGHPKTEALADVLEVPHGAVTVEMRDHAFAQWRADNNIPAPSRVRGSDPAPKKA